MSREKKDADLAGELRAERRRFLKESAAAVAGALLFGGPAWAALDGRWGVEFRADGGAAPAPAGVGVRHAGESAEFAKPFVNERYEFDVTFLRAKTATGVMSFTSTGVNEYTASLEAITSDIVNALTSLRKISLTSVMYVDASGARPRFVTKMFSRKMLKGSVATETRNELDYPRRRWSYSFYKNGVKTSGPRVRRIPPGLYYDDFVALLYNFRAQVYAPVEHGLKLTLNTLPWDRTVVVDGKKVNKSATTIDVEVPPNDQLPDDDRKWLAKSGAEYLIIVKLDKDVYGIPSGQAKFSGSAKLVPEGAWVENAVLFGDVQANRRK
jgi:hypothetical protein